MTTDEYVQHQRAEHKPVVGLDGEPCRSRSDNCPHTMVSRCPGCHREMWAPGVWDFSHGEVECQCGYAVTPRQRRLQEAPEWTI